MTDIHEQVAELTSGHTNRQPYTTHDGTNTQTHTHRTYVPALIDQLDGDCARPTNEQGFAGYQSAAPLWLEPMDTLAWIDERAANWLWRLGDPDGLADTKLRIRRLHGLRASQDSCGRTKPVMSEKTPRKPRKPICCTQHKIDHDVKHWWTTARVTSGWDSVAWKPDNTCPPCGERRTLRVKLADQIAFCTGCRETWDATAIGLLAEHIRIENLEDDGDVA